MLISHLSPELVQSVLDALPTPVFFKDRWGRYQGCNRAFTELTGRSGDELRGLTVFDLLPADAARVHAHADEALMQSGGQLRYEARFTQADGKRLDALLHKAPMQGPDGQVTGLVSTILDITERKALETRLAQLAEHDPLTGLLNRRAILSHLQALHAARRAAGQALCLLMIDVDHFKSINDQFGHGVGDEVLCQVAAALQGALRDGDSLGRVGGEEFLAVLSCIDINMAGLVAERLRQAVAQIPWMGDGQASRGITISVGLAQSQHDEDWAQAITGADKALYVAKRTGRDRVVVAEPSTRRP